MFNKLIQKKINAGATAVAAQFKTDILRILGEDIDSDVKDRISQYFDGGVARNQAEKALKEAGII